MDALLRVGTGTGSTMADDDRAFKALPGVATAGRGAHH
jgi:hypothetical protein